MSLSSFVASGAPSIFSGAHQAAAPSGGEPSNIPGTRSGVAPAPAPQPAPASVNSNPANPAATPSADNPLAAYAKPADTGSTQQPPADADIQLPTADQYSSIAKQLSSAVKIDQDLASAAIRGDSEALNKLLSSFGEQVMQQTLHASTVTGHELNKMNAAKTVKSTAESVNTAQAEAAAMSAAQQLDPGLATGLKATLLKTAITELRAQYPTAPAELIGKEAAKQLGYSEHGATQEAGNEAGTDWFTFTNSI